MAMGCRPALLTVGVSLSDYYEGTSKGDDTRGYVGVGIVASTPLRIPQSHGAWEVTLAGAPRHADGAQRR